MAIVTMVASAFRPMEMDRTDAKFLLSSSLQSSESYIC